MKFSTTRRFRNADLNPWYTQFISERKYSRIFRCQWAKNVLSSSILRDVIYGQTSWGKNWHISWNNLIVGLTQLSLNWRGKKQKLSRFFHFFGFKRSCCFHIFDVKELLIWLWYNNCNNNCNNINNIINSNTENYFSQERGKLLARSFLRRLQKCRKTFISVDLMLFLLNLFHCI